MCFLLKTHLSHAFSSIFHWKTILFSQQPNSFPLNITQQPKYMLLKKLNCHFNHILISFYISNTNIFNKVQIPKYKQSQNKIQISSTKFEILVWKQFFLVSKVLKDSATTKLSMIYTFVTYSTTFSLFLHPFRTPRLVNLTISFCKSKCWIYDHRWLCTRNFWWNNRL